MQISAGVWRNVVSGPGCAEMIVLAANDIGQLAPNERVDWGRREAGGGPLRCDRAARVHLLRIGSAAGCPELLSPVSPGKVFLLSVAQDLRQVGIAVVVGQHQHYLRIRPIGLGNGALGRWSLSPMGP